MRALIIRPATPTDIPYLAHLWYEKIVLLQQADPRWQMAAQARERWMAAACEWLETQTTTLLVADDNGSAAGYILVSITPGLPGLLPEQRGLVSDIAIDAHRYRAGIGRSLVQAAQNWLAQRDVRQMVVMTPRRDTVTQAFWRSLGAREWMDGLWMKF